MLVETDKVDTELPSPVSGTVVSYSVSVDDEVAVGDEVCIIEHDPPTI